MSEPIDVEAEVMRVNEHSGVYKAVADAPKVETPEAPAWALKGEGRMRTRAEAKEACRLRFVANMGKLSEIARIEGVELNTLYGWSEEGRWSEQRQAARGTIAEVQGKTLTDWFFRKQEEQVKRALRRGRTLQHKVDELLEKGDVWISKEGDVQRVPLGAKSLQAVAMTEERMDLVIRRNLNMESESGAGSTNITVNALSSTVQVAEL